MSEQISRLGGQWEIKPSSLVAGSSEHRRRSLDSTQTRQKLPTMNATNTYYGSSQL